MKTVQFLFFTAFAFSLLALSCAEPPVEEMNQAAEAVTVAESSNDAIYYAPQLLNRAKTVLKNMYLEAENKNYDLAKSLAAEAVSLAEQAIREGHAAAEKEKQEASVTVMNIDDVISEIEQIINAAKEAGLDLDYNSIENEFDAICQTVAQAQEALSTEQFKDAIKIADTAKANCELIKQQISEVAISVSSKK